MGTVVLKLEGEACTTQATNHDGQSSENVKTMKTNGILLRNRQIHNIFGQISSSYVWSSCFFVAVNPSLWNPEGAVDATQRRCTVSLV